MLLLRGLIFWIAGWRTRNPVILLEGKGIKDNREEWFIQGHIGSTWKDEQYFRTRDMKYVRPAFEDLLKRLQTDYIDLGMINKFYDLATMQPEVPASVKSHYELLKHKASECIGCQACEARCL